MKRMNKFDLLLMKVVNLSSGVDSEGNNTYCALGVPSAAEPRLVVKSLSLRVQLQRTFAALTL